MNTNSNPESEDDDLFYFESDHLALKGNKDYSEVLKTIFILEAQRSTAIQVNILSLRELVSNNLLFRITTKL